MKFKIIFASILGVMNIAAAVWAFPPSHQQTSPEQQNATMALGPLNHEESYKNTRMLQEPGFNCLVANEVNCEVASDGSDCKNLYIRNDLCGNIDVKMNYTFCNLEDDPIILLVGKTQAMMYNDFTLPLDRSTMTGKECRTKILDETIDTCKRKYISASLKVEGWRGFFENEGYYCYAYTHYFPEINKYDLPGVPIGPNPEVTITQILCYLETTQGSGEYTTPCNSLNRLYFETSLVGNNIGSGIVEVPNYVRNVRITTVVENESQENVDVLRANVLFGDEDYITLRESDGAVILSGRSLSTPKTFAFDFAEVFGETIDIISAIETRGQMSGIEATAADRTAFIVPKLEFQWEMDFFVDCFVRSTSGQSCQDYIVNNDLTATDSCDTDVFYQFVARNVGTKCEEVTSIVADILGESGSLPNIPLQGWSASKKLFCPGEELFIRQPIRENLCNRAGTEVAFGVRMNDASNQEIGSAQFPMPNTIGSMFILALDPEINCFVQNELGQRISCEEHLTQFNCNTESVVETVSYTFTIRNIGDACLDLNSIGLFVGDSGRLPIKTLNWEQDKRNFCGEESLKLKKTNVRNVDLCEYLGREVDVKVIVNGGGSNREAFGSLTFPFTFPVPNSAPVKAPVSSPVSSPVSDPTEPSCESPKEIEFKIIDASCGVSSQRKRSLGGGGLRHLKNKKKKNSASEVDFPCECNSCNDHSPFSAISSWKREVQIYSMGDSSQLLYEGIHIKHQKFTFRPEDGNMPECLVMVISEYGGEVLQTVSFDTSTCSILADSTGGKEATYGAVRVCSFA